MARIAAIIHFEDSYRSAHEKGYAGLKTAAWYLEDYHMLQGMREEKFTAVARHHLKHSGVPVENSKGEWGLGQHEINIRYADTLTRADRHAVYKQCLKEVAEQLDVSVTFMAKYATGQAGSSCHIHLSLWQEGNNLVLEKPDIQDEKIIACLQDEYGLHIVQVAFLPLGADSNTAVYRVAADDETAYFLKLRGGAFDETSVALPKFLSHQGVVQIIPPLTTKIGQLWANLDAFKTILYPFVEGHNGYEVHLSESHWREFGAALKRIHTAELPAALISRIRQETFSPQGREIVKTFLARIEDDVFDDPVAVKLAAFLQAKRDEILDLVGQAERLAQAVQAQPPEFIVCHSDIHAGNVLIDANNDAFYIVDWDEPILAPKERDLMYIGGGLMASQLTPQEEETLFYQTYGQTQIDPVALAYYRYERIIQDISEYCQQLFLTNEGGEDREQSLHYLKSNFLPNSTIEIAYQSDKTLH